WWWRVSRSSKLTKAAARYQAKLLKLPSGHWSAPPPSLTLSLSAESAGWLLLAVRLLSSACSEQCLASSARSRACRQRSPQVSQQSPAESPKLSSPLLSV